MRNFRILGFVAIFFLLIFPAACAKKAERKAAAVGKALPEGGYNAEISIEDPPSSIRAKGTTTVRVAVKNISDSVWPAGGVDGKFMVALGDHWLDKDGKLLINDADRAGLSKDLTPGESVVLDIPLKAPASAGDYIVEYDMLQEMVAWFKDKGSKTARFKIKVVD